MSSPGAVNLVRCLKCGEIIKGSRYDVALLVAHIHNKHPEIDIVDTDTKCKRHFHDAPTTSTPKNLTRPEAEDTIENHPHCSGEGYESDQNFTTDAAKQPQDIALSHYSATSEVLAQYPEIKECEYAPHNPNAQVAYLRRYKLSASPSPVSVRLLQQPFQHTLYRTSLEKWSPANGSIYCPKCGSNKRPLIKTKAERFTHNKCGACCLLSCWPFCFIPWIMPGQNQDYLYCANCKTFLGLYDRHRNCLKPNRLYLSSGNRQPEQQQEEANNEKENWNEVGQNKLLANESPPPQSLATDNARPRHVTSITINGQELPPNAVARLEKYKRFGSMVGIDLNALTDAPHSTQRQVAHRKPDAAAPSIAKENKRLTA